MVSFVLDDADVGGAAFGGCIIKTIRIINRILLIPINSLLYILLLLPSKSVFVRVVHATGITHHPFSLLSALVLEVDAHSAAEAK